MPLALHVMQRLVDSRVIVRTVAQRRHYAETVLRIGKDHGLFCFGSPDNHSHVGLECDTATVGRFCQRLATSLRKSLDLPVAFNPAHVVEVQDQRHLKNAFFYMLSQAEHHGVEADPLLEATCLPDLLGLRVTGSYLSQRVRALLPRVRRADLLGAYGLTELEPSHDLRDLADAAASAVAAPALEGRAAPVVRARSAAIQFAREAGASIPDVARLLGLTPRGVRISASGESDPALARALGLQLGLRALRGAPPDSFEK